MYIYIYTHTYIHISIHLFVYIHVHMSIYIHNLGPPKRESRRGREGPAADGIGTPDPNWSPR